AIALGASNVSLVEMTAAYAAFDNRGFGVWPYGIGQIMDADGNVLYKRTGSGPGQVVGARAVGEMLDLMQSVVSSGTGKGANIGARGGRKARPPPVFPDAPFTRLRPRPGAGGGGRKRRTPRRKKGPRGPPAPPAWAIFSGPGGTPQTG